MFTNIPTEFPKVPGFNLNFRPNINLIDLVRDHTDELQEELIEKELEGITIEEYSSPSDLDSTSDYWSIQRVMHKKVTLAHLYENVGTPMNSLFVAKPEPDGILYLYAFEVDDFLYDVTKVAKTDKLLTFGQLIYLLDRVEPRRQGWVTSGAMFGMIYTLMDYSGLETIEDIREYLDNWELSSKLYPQLYRWYKEAIEVFLEKYRKVGKSKICFSDTIQELAHYKGAHHQP